MDKATGLEKRDWLRALAILENENSHSRGACPSFSTAAREKIVRSMQTSAWRTPTTGGLLFF
jgi:hypothetical protein